MLLDPFPNQLSKSRSMIPAFAEHLIWYPLLGLALVGMVRMRRWRPEIAYVTLVGLGTVTMWALIDRNFGTAYRHRGEFLWAVVVLAAVVSDAARRAISSHGSPIPVLESETPTP